MEGSRRLTALGVRRFLQRFAGEELEVAPEARTRWRFAAEELRLLGARVRLAEPAETSARKGNEKRARSSRGTKGSMQDRQARGAFAKRATPSLAGYKMPQPGQQSASAAELGLGWLCPTEADRARMLDMGPRALRARTIALAATGAGMLAAAGALGWWVLVPFAVAIATLGTFEWRIRRARRPERVVASTLLLIVGLMGGSVALTGGATSPALAWMMIPVAISAMRFRAQVVWALAACAALTAVSVAFMDGVQHTIDHPLGLIALFVLLLSVTATTTALMHAELQFRSQSALDPLTGLLNRSGLERRFAEVREQARLLNRPVCLILCDLDHFKHVNDDHGHERGDAVLREASSQMAASLRTFELFYRVGGEEFLVLLPGIDLPRGVKTAQSMRAAVEAGRPGGLPVTASFGVSVATGDDIDFLPLYKAADHALYRAKSEGRNLVTAIEVAPALADDALVQAQAHNSLAGHPSAVGGQTLPVPATAPALLG